MKNSRAEVLKNTKLKLREKYDVSVIEAVEKKFWETLRHYLTNPVLVKEGILINNLMKFKFRYGKIKFLLENRELSETKREILNKILENNGKN
jgi:hypothetical protein